MHYNLTLSFTHRGVH